MHREDAPRKCIAEREDVSRTDAVERIAPAGQVHQASIRNNGRIRRSTIARLGRLSI